MTTQSELDAILHNAAIAPLPNRAFLRVTGTDATRWLNGMVTNSIQALQPGEGNYNFLLNAQGRIQGDCTIFREPTSGDATFILATTRDQIATLKAHLDKFIIMDDVELHDMDMRYPHTILLVGAKAPAVLHHLEQTLFQTTHTFADSAPLTIHIYPHSDGLFLTRRASTEPRFELSFELPLDQVLDAAHEAGAIDASDETLEALRILEGQPAFSIDIRDKDLPQETNQPQALHFNKGCYLGQEIVERIRSRGQVHRLFTKFTLTGQLPTELPAPLISNEKPAGELTSATKIGDTLYALGYARREFLDTHAPLTYEGGSANPRI